MTPPKNSHSPLQESIQRELLALSYGCSDKKLYFSWMTSPLGPMLALADDKKLYLLEFIERRHLSRELKKTINHHRASLEEYQSAPIQSVAEELKEYFAGRVKTFKTPLELLGTDFQKAVWNTLKEIPYGQTCSYLEEAKRLQRPLSVRAVANANGANQLAIIIPCHRVITHDGKLGGYGGGLSRKEWLLEHEKSFINSC